MVRPVVKISLCLVLPILVLGVARADYFDDTGYRSLAAALGKNLPDGTGQSVTQVEFGDLDYLPQAGSGNFAGTGNVMAGKIFSSKSGASSASTHAFAVGEHFYGLNTNPMLGRAGFTPGIGGVDVYRVDSTDSNSAWTEDAWLTPGSFNAPLLEPNVVQNHSWISVGGSGSASRDNNLLRRFDFAIVRDGFLAATGVNNASSAVPALMASAYNNLAVGLSSGNHSTGGVASWIDGPGRQKPEIVAPLDFTSFSTALVSSAAVLLRQEANRHGAAAARPETLKAILLAGATKEEFSGWTHTVTAPLDPIFGAGELHVGNSWYILAGQEQSANLSPPRPDFAWTRVMPPPDGTADYLLSLPPGFTGESLSAVACWNRIVRDTNDGARFVMTVDPVVDYNLSLSRVPVTGSPVVLEESLSSIENVEHVYRRNLPSGTYRLRLSLEGGRDVPAALAWRLTPVAHRPAITLTGDQLGFTGLIPDQSYLIQSSTDLRSWNPEQAFTATGTFFTWSIPVNLTRLFYRLAATD